MIHAPNPTFGPTRMSKPSVLAETMYAAAKPPAPKKMYWSTVSAIAMGRAGVSGSSRVSAFIQTQTKTEARKEPMRRSVKSVFPRLTDIL